MIIHKHKLIYVHIPKNGGSSIEKFFRYGKFKQPLPIDNPFSVKSVDHEGEVHLPAIVLRNSFPEFFRKYFKFTIVRNTWDFILSAYLWLDQTYGLQTVFREWIALGFPGVPVRERNLFLNPRQIDWIMDEHGNVLVDYIGRFERLQEEFETVCRLAGIEGSNLPHINSTEHRHYSAYYDDESRKIIARRYREDIDFFGFVFEDKA